MSQNIAAFIWWIIMLGVALRWHFYLNSLFKRDLSPFERKAKGRHSLYMFIAFGVLLGLILSSLAALSSTP